MPVRILNAGKNVITAEPAIRGAIVIAIAVTKVDVTLVLMARRVTLHYFTLAFSSHKLGFTHTVHHNSFTMDNDGDPKSELSCANKYIDGRLLLFFLPVAITPTSVYLRHQIPGRGDHLLRTYDIVFPPVNYRPVSVARMKTDTFRPESIEGTAIQLALFAEANPNEEDSVPCQSTLAANTRGLQTYLEKRMTIKTKMNDSDITQQHGAFVSQFFDLLTTLRDRMYDSSTGAGAISFEDACNTLHVQMFKDRAEYALPNHLVNAPWFLKCQYCLQLSHPFRIGIIDGGHRLTWMYLHASMSVVLPVSVEGIGEYIVVRKAENVKDSPLDANKFDLLVQVYIASPHMSTERYRRKCLDASDSLVDRESVAIPGETIHE